VLSESESSLCTNFKFCEEKNHTHFMMYKAKQFMMTKKNSKKSLHILEDTASGMQVGDTEQVVV
jgi:hypothetical protein